ncbi:MAG: hypothetical protein Q9M24_00045 [Mariprofundaceae bacterium]|nr:hypothetical protein [Mariprofundaceae bacterium]
MTAAAGLMAFPDLDSADQFIIAEMSGILNTQMLGHLPDFSDGNHSVTRALVRNKDHPPPTTILAAFA